MCKKNIWLSKLLKSDIVLVTIIIALGIAVLFWQVFIKGKVIVPGDIPYKNPFWRTIEPNRYNPPQNLLLFDQISQFYVWHHIASKSMKANRSIPLWNPHEFTGQPLIANAQSSLFYPPNLLLFCLSPGQVASVRAVFNLLLAGIFTFFFCRELQICRKGSLLSSIAFSFSGPLIVWLGHPHANVLACLPLIMWAGEKLLGQDRTYYWGCIISLGVAMSILGGHPETTFHVLGVFTLYVCLKLIFLKIRTRKKLKLFTLLLMAISLGFMIGSVQLIPFAKFLFQSSTFAHGGRSMGGTNFLYSKEWLANASTLFTMLYPNFFGNPTTNNYFWAFNNYQNYNEQAIYFGLIPIALAMGAVFASKKQLSFKIIAILALFCIGVAWRLPGFELVNHLPIFSISLNKRLKLPFVFLAAVMAGFGYRAFREYIASNREKNIKTFHGIRWTFLTTIIVFLVITTLKYTLPLVIELKPETVGYHLFFNIFSWDQIKTVTTILVAIAASIGYFIMLMRKLLFPMFERLLIVLTLVELLIIGWGYNPTIKEADIFPVVQAVDVLQKQETQPFRIMATDGIFPANYGAVYGLSYIGGYDFPVFQRYSDLYVTQGGKVDYRQLWDPEWPLVNALNVKYIISSRKLNKEQFNLIYRTDYFKIYKNKNAMPRAYMVYNAKIINEKNLILENMLNGEFDSQTCVILEKPLPQSKINNIANPSDNRLKFSVEFITYGNDFVLLDVFTEEPGILVMSDLFTQDWKAQIDMQEVELYRANYCYRAVYVPAGKHQVSFSYCPLSFLTGAILSVLGLTISIFGIFLI